MLFLLLLTILIWVNLKYGRHELQCLHKKEHYANRSEKRKKLIRRNFGSHGSEPERKPSDVVCKEDGFRHSAAGATTIVQRDHERGPESIYNLVTEFENIFLRVANQEQRWNALELVNLADKTIEINGFKLHIKSNVNCEDSVSWWTYEIMKGDGFYRILMRVSSTKNDGHGTPYE